MKLKNIKYYEKTPSEILETEFKFSKTSEQKLSGSLNINLQHESGHF